MWTQPSHFGLIQNYTVSIRHNNGTSITSKSVGKKTSFTFPYNFIPGYRYYVTIASNVQIQQPREQFTESSDLGIVLGKTHLKLLKHFQNQIRTTSEQWLNIVGNTWLVLYTMTEYGPAHDHIT